jgi:hypothetical protein
MHKYHLWEDYSGRNNECIVKWNARAREVHERKNCNRARAAKQGMSDDFWFKPITREFNGEVFIEEHARR